MGLITLPGSLEKHDSFQSGHRDVASDALTLSGLLDLETCRYQPQELYPSMPIKMLPHPSSFMPSLCTQSLQHTQNLFPMHVYLLEMKFLAGCVYSALGSGLGSWVFLAPNMVTDTQTSVILYEQKNKLPDFKSGDTCYHSVL